MIAETSQFADHLARTHFLRLCADGRPAFLVPHALVQDLPDQSTESVGDGPNRLGMSEAWDDPTVDDGKDLTCRISSDQSLLENGADRTG